MIASTVAGLAGVLAFHTTGSRLNLAGLQAGPAASAPAGSSAAAAGGTSGNGTGKGSTSGARPRAKGTASGSQSAVGPEVNYRFGVLSVRVTVSGSKIVRVGIASLSDGGNPRSQDIDEQAIPILEQEVIQAQSANIQGVSGASFTSAGFEQSLQSALHSLGYA